MRKMDFITHLSAAAIVTITCAFIYASVQQSHRSSANDPQLGMAADIANSLKKGESADRWLASDTVELSHSLSVFTALYDDQGQPIKSTGVLDGQLPALPKGVFDFARKNRENVFTWQPERGVRMAIVLRSITSPAYSFVAVGRSLREIEKREDNLLWMAIVSWGLCIGVIAFHWLICFIRAPRL